MRRARRAHARDGGHARSARAVRSGEPAADVPRAQRDAYELPRGGGEQESLLVHALRRAQRRERHHVPLRLHRHAPVQRLRGRCGVYRADRRMARPSLGEGHARNARARALLRGARGVPQPRGAGVLRRSVRGKRRGAVRQSRPRRARTRRRRGRRPSHAAQGESRAVGGARSARSRRARGVDRARHHRLQGAPPLAARDPRPSARGAVDARRHGDGARQVAYVPGVRRPARAHASRGEPVRVPAACAHRRPGVPPHRSARGLRSCVRGAHGREPAGGARPHLRGPRRQLGRHRAHHARVPDLPRRRNRGMQAHRVRGGRRSASHRAREGGPARGVHPTRHGHRAPRHAGGARGDGDRARRGGKRHRLHAAARRERHRRDRARQPAP